MSWNLDRVLGRTFFEQQIDGEILADVEIEDFDAADFPKARPMHWKKFNRKLEDARKNGVKLATIVASATVPAVTAAPDVSSLTTKKAFYTRLTTHVQTAGERWIVNCCKVLGWCQWCC